MFIKTSNGQKTIEVMDLFYDETLKAFRYVDEEGTTLWILREFVHSLAETR